MKTIVLTNSSKFALVDDSDYDKVIKLSWYLDKDGYARTNIDGNNWNMSEYILGYIEKTLIDHKDSVNLNNQRHNLRRATASQNQANSKRKSNAVGYRGVMFTSGGRFLYRAQIKVNGVAKHIGSFNDIDEAARAYDREATKYFGEFAKLNFPI